ncbi:MAG: hypothetical protein SWK76_08100 [Actinomycetota bacterium]|nr:hypothetical protein [Actinomycetota bacterium]
MENTSGAEEYRNYSYRWVVLLVFGLVLVVKDFPWIISLPSGAA